MSFRRRKIKPPEASREYRKLYVIAVEGDRTETKYFRFFQDEIDSIVVAIEVIPPKSESDPQNVFKKLQRYVADPSLKGTLERWMVIDRDQWSVEVLNEVVQQCREKNVGLCVSNPAFPFWLLLHFENGESIAVAENNKSNTSAKECETKLREERYLPGFSKNLTQPHWEVLRNKLDTAIKNAKELDQPPCLDYPRQRTGSTVYRLVEKLKAALHS